jgi:hypothetical protein
MALTIETGAGIPGADSYATIAEADAYHTALGNTAWIGTDAVKEVALRQAAQYMNFSYSWKGAKTAQANTLAWPRHGVVDADGFIVDSGAIPVQVKNAQIELALRALSGSLVTDTQAGAKVAREKVDVIERQYFAGQTSQAAFVAVDRMLYGLITGGGSSAVVQMILG